MKRKLLTLVCFVMCALTLTSCSPYSSSYSYAGAEWCMGFGSREIPLPETEEPLYIAGFKNGKEIEGVLDLARANALWADAGGSGIILIGIDCIGVGSGTVGKIRDALSDFCREVGCASVNVYATHTHAGIDTMGLWGPVAVNGKNPDYTSNLIEAAVAAAKEAYADRTSGRLYYGSAVTEDILYDSRRPIEFDSELHQLRFEPEDMEKNGIRLLGYSAHAESLGGDNNKLSRDFPGMLSDLIKEKTGDDSMYLPGAIGGLIMTRELAEPFDAEENMRLTARALADAVLSIDGETELSAQLSYSGVKIELPLDNTYFFFGKFLGILDNPVKRGESETGYLIESEVGVLKLGSVTFALIPGEIFPELVSGRGLKNGDPEPLCDIAKRHGTEKLLVLGLCNDELGYILPQSNFKLNEKLPYIETVKDPFGEDHYEETNSLGIRTAEIIADAFERALEALK